jgi:hypothetical protein
VANTLDFKRIGAVGFIDWLDERVSSAIIDHLGSFPEVTICFQLRIDPATPKGCAKALTLSQSSRIIGIDLGHADATKVCRAQQLYRNLAALKQSEAIAATGFADAVVAKCAGVALKLPHYG